MNRWILLALALAAVQFDAAKPAIAQAPEAPRVKCTTAGGPISIGTEKITVPLKCCPPGMYVANLDHPELDKKGNLICAEET